MKGKYVAAKLSPESVDFIYTMLDYYNIPNLLDKEDLHTTIIYSKNKPMDGCDYEIEMNEVGTIDSFDVFDDKLLVIKVKSEYLDKRHETLMKDFDGEYDFPEYIAHITVSKDITDFDIPELDDKFKIEIIYDNEFTEELLSEFVYEGLINSIKDKVSFLKDKFKYGGDEDLEELFYSSPIKSKSISTNEIKETIFNEIKNELSEEWFNGSGITPDSINIINDNKVIINGTFKDYVNDTIHDIFRKYFKYVISDVNDSSNNGHIEIYFNDDIEKLLLSTGYLYNTTVGDMYVDFDDNVVEVIDINDNVVVKDGRGNEASFTEEEFFKSYTRQIKETYKDYKHLKEYYSQIKEQLNLLEK